MGDGQDNYVHLGNVIVLYNVKSKLIEESPCAALTEEDDNKYVTMLLKLHVQQIIEVQVRLNF